MKRKVFFIILIGIAVLSWSETSFHFAVLSDRTGGADQIEYEKVVKDIQNLYPDLVVTVGDIIEDGLYEDWDSALKPIRKLKCPIYFTPGNNDIQDEQTELNYKEMTGFDPYHSFDHENSHFIILDNSRFTDYEEMEDQITWLKQDLEASKLSTNIFVLMHKPFWAESISRDTDDPLHDIFVNYKVKAVFTGHWHHYSHEKIDEIDYFICGSSGGVFGDLRIDDLAEFYQFLWCYVEDDEVSFTLMKSGATFNKDIKNLEESNFIYQIPQSYIKTNCQIIDPATNLQNLEIIIVNNTDEIMIEQIELISDNWSITEKIIPVNIDPKDTLVYELPISTITSELPFPELRFNYPFGRNKHFPYKKPILVKRMIQSKRTIIAPEIDGMISPTEWIDAEIDRPLSSLEGYPAELETSLSMMNDDKNLYIIATCNFTGSDAVLSKGEDQQYSIFNDDHIGFLLSSDLTNFVQIYLNSEGKYYFQKTDRKNNSQDKELTEDYSFAANMDDDSWTIELKLPLKDFSFETERKIFLNLRRHNNLPNINYFLIPQWSYDSVKQGIVILN